MRTWEVERYQVNGLLQVGDEDGPVVGEVGYGESVPNATVQIRGQTSSRNAQKNYKIELKKNKRDVEGTADDQFKQAHDRGAAVPEQAFL